MITNYLSKSKFYGKQVYTHFILLITHYFLINFIETRDINTKNSHKYDANGKREILFNEVLHLISTLYKAKDNNFYDEKISRFYLQVNTPEGFKRSSFIEVKLNEYVNCLNYKDIGTTFSKGKVDAKMKFAIRCKPLGKAEIKKKVLETGKEKDEGGISDNESKSNNIFF